MTITCTSTVRHGDTQLTATGTGATREEAFTAAVEATDVGYRPGTLNTQGGLELLGRYHNLGERPDPGKFLKAKYAYLTIDDEGGPRLAVGWVDFTFSDPRVKLWAIAVHVDFSSPDERWNHCRTVPTFYLDPSVQGIVDEAHAIKIAEDILHTAAGDAQGVSLHITAVPIY